MKKQHMGKIAGLMAAMTILATPQAKATLTFVVNNGNSQLTGAGFFGPYGTIAVTWINSTTANVNLTASGSYAFGDGGTLGLNLNGSGFSITSLSGTPAVGSFNAANYSSAEGGNPANLDGFGDFSFRINTQGQGGADNAVTSLSFTLNATTGWASEAAMLTLNNKGYEVGGHVYANGGAVTGFASTGGVVPEPSTIIAGALLLLPFGASTIRILRKNRVA